MSSENSDYIGPVSLLLSDCVVSRRSMVRKPSASRGSTMSSYNELAPTIVTMIVLFTVYPHKLTLLLLTYHVLIRSGVITLVKSIISYDFTIVPKLRDLCCSCSSDLPCDNLRLQRLLAPSAKCAWAIDQKNQYPAKSALLHHRRRRSGCKRTSSTLWSCCSPRT